MHLAVAVVAVTPQDQFLEDEEQDNAGEHGREHLACRCLLQAGGDHPKESGAKQGPRGVADQQGHQPVPDNGGNSQQQRGTGDRANAAQNAEAKNPEYEHPSFSEESQQLCKV
jgi:hypothetical protein